MALARWLRRLFGGTSETPDSTPIPPTTVAWNADLYADLRLNPDPTRRAVLADWLLENGDVRGALINAQCSGAPADQLLRQYAFHFYAPLHLLDPRVIAPGDPFFPEDERWGEASDHPSIGWYQGFIDRAWIRCDRDSAVSLRELNDFFASPSCWLLRELVLGGSRFGSFAKLDPVTTVTSLRIGDFLYPEECEMSWSELGRWDHLADTFPNARHVHVQGAIDALRLPKGVETFILQSSTTQGFVVRQVVPALMDAKRVEIWTGSRNYGSDVTIDDVLPLLDGHMEHLGVMDSMFTDDLIDPLATSGVLPGLRTLDLSLGTLTDAGARRLLEHRDAFIHLERIDLDRMPWVGSPTPCARRSVTE